MSGASNIKLMYLLAIGAARKTHRHPVAVHHARPIDASGACEQARQRGVRIRMLTEGDDHRRDAGEARQPLPLSDVYSTRASRSPSINRR